MTVPTITRRHNATLAFRLGMVVFLMAGGRMAAQDPPEKLESPAQTPRGPMSQSKADRARRLEELRKRREKPAIGASESRLGERARRIAEEGIFYKFTPGQVIAYRLDVIVERAEETERFYGNPVFTVREVEASGNAELAAVGMLRYYSKPSGEANFAPTAGKEVWVGSRILLDTHARHVKGKADFNQKALPFVIEDFVELKRLFFPQLPASAPGELSAEGSATLSKTERQGPLFLLKFDTIKGVERLTVRAEPEDRPVVRLHKERSFRWTEGGRREWKFASVSRFDRDRGLLLDSEAALTSENGDQKSTPVRICVKLLEGQELAQAQKQATADAKEMPAELEAKEFQRVRLEGKGLPRLQSVDEAKPGATVAHFNNDTHKWYLSDVVEVVSKYEVKIRYQASGEELTVPAGCLAFPAKRADAGK